MARDVEALVLQMSADLRRFDRSMQGMRAAADKRLNEVERRARQADKNLTRIMDDAGRNMTGSLRRSLGSLAPTLAAAFSTQQVIKYADSYTTLQNRLKVAGLEGEALKRVEDALYEASNRNGVAIDAVSQLYQRASLSRKALGASDEQLIALTDGVTAALRVQGVSAQAATGPLLQLSQAIGAGIVRAEEFNSLAEGTPVILQAAAAGSKRFGGDIATLRAEVLKGTVTSKEFFAALLAGLPAVEAQATSFNKTVGQALQTLDNNLGRYIGQADSGLSATARLAQGIDALANNLDTVILLVGVAGALAGGKFVYGMTAAGTAMAGAAVNSLRLAAFQTAMTASMTGTTRATLLSTTAMNGFKAALVTNPLGVLLVALTAVVGGLYVLSQRFGQAAVAARELNEITDRADDVLGRYEQAQIDAKKATAENAAAARDHAAALREEATELVKVAQLNAQKRISEATAAREAAERRESEAAARIARTSNGSFSEATLSQNVGANQAAEGARALADSARERANEAITEYNRLKAETDRITAGRNLDGAGVAPPATVVSGAAGAGGEDRAAKLRDELAVEREIAHARATGDDRAIKAAEERQVLARLTRQYTDAGFEDANAQALEHLALLNQAEVAVEEREAAEREVDLILEGRQRQLEREADYEQRLIDGARDRLGYEAELARLRGDTRASDLLERRLWIEDRINELLRLRPELSRAEAEVVAGGEAEAMDAASAQGRFRDLVVEAGTDFAGLTERAGDAFKRRALEGLADQLFKIIGAATKGLDGGGGFLSSIVSGLGSIFGGGRAMGGPVRAGSVYKINENTPNSEYFAPAVNGTVLTAAQMAMQNANQVRASQASAGGLAISVTPSPYFEVAVRKVAAPVAAQGSLAAYQAGQADIAARQRRARQSFGVVA